MTPPKWWKSGLYKSVSGRQSGAKGSNEPTRVDQEKPQMLGACAAVLIGGKCRKSTGTRGIMTAQARRMTAVSGKKNGVLARREEGP